MTGGTTIFGNPHVVVFFVNKVNPITFTSHNPQWSWDSITLGMPVRMEAAIDGSTWPARTQDHPGLWEDRPCQDHQTPRYSVKHDSPDSTDLLCDSTSFECRTVLTECSYMSNVLTTVHYKTTYVWCMYCTYTYLHPLVGTIYVCSLNCPSNLQIAIWLYDYMLYWSSAYLQCIYVHSCVR